MVSHAPISAGLANVTVPNQSGIAVGLEKGNLAFNRLPIWMSSHL